MKQLIFTTLSLAITFSICSQNLDDLHFGTDTTLDVATWNIEWFPKEGQTTIDYVTDILQAMEADVIAVQEIDQYDKFVAMMDALEGWEGISTNTGYLNLAYIYNPEFVEVTSIYQILPGNSRELPRLPLVMEMIFQGNEYVLINNHLKCCGDGYMDISDPWDEETRRYDACILIDEYIRENFPEENVILLGDLNDLLTDTESNNVFQVFFNDPFSYHFTDIGIAEGSTANWSYPSWPSHLDHIMISNELFDEFEGDDAEILTIKIDEYLENGFWEYEQNVSDHRPVGLKIKPVQGSAGVYDQQLQPGLEVYPNPSSGYASVHFDNAQPDSKLEIATLSGRIIKTIPIRQGQSSAKLQNHGIPDGIYFARLISGNRLVATEKLVILPGK